MLADNDMDLQTARLHIWHTAWLLDNGRKGNFESSRAKVVCSEATWRVVDRCVQILGGQGVTAESPLVGMSVGEAESPPPPPHPAATSATAPSARRRISRCAPSAATSWS